MTSTVLFPYGLSNFEQIVTEGYVFVDKTNFLPLLEREVHFAAFLRPRRFGKSLFLSLLEYYYDKKHKSKFDTLFGKYYIGKKPTSLANQYRVLNFNFSGIDTNTRESSYEGFVFAVKKGILEFLKDNPIFSEKDKTWILENKGAEQLINAFFALYPTHEGKVYLLIDEYDHFTNEILLRDVEEFKESVSQNGYVRKFYEVIKNATQSGVVDRCFITGVSPITLDSLTIGFNILTHLTKSNQFHDLLGFTQEEVENLLTMTLQDKGRLPQIMEDLKTYYNGYKFHSEWKHTLYNSDMVLYFLREFRPEQTYPKQILDPNIMPDYGKIKKMFEVANWQENMEVLETILREGVMSSTEIYQFSFEKDFGKAEFINFLYYMGNLTLAGEDMAGMPLYKIPNMVIAELYWKYYTHILQQRAELPREEDKVLPAMIEMALGNEKNFFVLIQRALEALSNRDFQKFDEKYVKMLIVAYGIQAGVFYITTERELSAGKYVDIEMFVRPNNNKKHYQYVLEVKYLKSATKKKLNECQKMAEMQLKGYIETDELLKSKEN
jgi:hypothetical protein